MGEEKRQADDGYMLTRILEPEVMDTEQEARDYDSMDHSGRESGLRPRFICRGVPFGANCDSGNRRWAGEDSWQTGRKIRHYSLADEASRSDLGHGTAPIPIELCRSDRWASVVAVDLSEEMLKRENEYQVRRFRRSDST